MRSLFSALLLLLPGLLALPIHAQTVPELESPYVKVEGLGPAVEGDAFRWSLEYSAKVPGLTRIEVRDPLEQGQGLLVVVEGKSIYTKTAHPGLPLTPERFQWIYEQPTTFRMLEVVVARGKDLSRLHVPLSFSEGTKSTLRFLVRERLGYTQPTVAAPPYQLFDGRKWIVQTVNKRDDRTEVEYRLEGEQPSDRRETVTQTMVVSPSPAQDSLGDFVKGMRERLRASCAGGEWLEVTVSHGGIYYEWLVTKCNAEAARHELGVVRPVERGLVWTRYCYGEGRMPDLHHGVWKRLLSGH